MDIKAFYRYVSDTLRKGGYSLFDKLKLDNSDLVNAVKNSDPLAVAEALNAWVNPNKPDGLERLALPMAVDNNNELIVGMLLYKKANPNVRDQDGETALYKAVFWQNENIVRLLLDKGATPSFPNLDGKTALQAAKENGYKNILALLTNDQAELKRMQLEKDIATHKNNKAKAQQAKASKLEDGLMPSLTNENKVEKEDYSAQDLVIKSKYKEIGNPLEALINAIKNQDSRAVKYFTEQVDDLNQDFKGEMPLQLAIQSGKEKLAIFFVDYGADPFLKDKDGNLTLLNSIVQHQMYDLINVGFKKIENTSQILNNASQSFSAQFLAYKDAKMMNILLENGADPFFGGKDGCSPILKAMQKGSIAILPVLARHKVPFDQKIDDKPILQWAIELERTDWVNGLITEKATTKLSQSDLVSLKEIAKNSNLKAIQLAFEAL